LWVHELKSSRGIGHLKFDQNAMQGPLPLKELGLSMGLHE
jgi:hypothetical protein